MVLSGLTAISSGCTTTEARQTERLVAASKTLGVTRAKTNPPDLPSECREHMGRVVPKAGEKARWTQKRWEFSADQIDAQIDRCAQFHDDWTKGSR